MTAICVKDHLTDEAFKLGFTNILTYSGVFSRVYAHPSDQNKIVKFFYEYGYNRGYLAWLDFCINKNNENNPFCPVIHDFREIQAYDGIYCFMVEMERLKKLGDNDDNYLTSYWIEDMTRDVISRRNNIDPLQTIVSNTVTEHERSAESKDQVKYFRKALNVILDNNFMSVLSHLSDAVRNGLGSADLHQGNWMLRGEQFVVTDPLCG